MMSRRHRDHHGHAGDPLDRAEICGMVVELVETLRADLLVMPMGGHNSPCPRSRSRVRDQAVSSVSDSSSQENAEETARSSVSRKRKAVPISE